MSNLPNHKFFMCFLSCCNGKSGDEKNSFVINTLIDLVINAFNANQFNAVGNECFYSFHIKFLLLG